MEKAILKTLIYADIFDYPLKIYEIHKWLIGKKATLRQVEKALGKLVDRLQPPKASLAKGGVTGYRGFYCLPRRKNIVSSRLIKTKQSQIYFKKAQALAMVLKIIPWIKLAGISGGLALNNADKKDDIDLFIITAKNRLWIGRLLILGLLSLMGQRRKRGDSGKKVAGKFCINVLLEEDKLEQKNKDIFVAHEVLQMKVLWQRDGVYSRYLADNGWAFKYLPNWVNSSSDLSLRGVSHRATWQSILIKIPTVAFGDLGMTIENIAKRLQLKIMQKPKGMERIEDGALYFHPQDCRLKVLNEFEKRISRFGFGTP